MTLSSLSRAARKDLTRSTLVRTALLLLGEGRSFGSLGIREITRHAGLLPNAFYRHFSTTDELGLDLVTEAGLTLRRLLREARQEPPVRGRDLIRHSVQTYQAYVRQNRLLFLFISSERAGSSRTLRAAIRSEVSHFTTEMAQDFRRMGAYPDLSTAHLQMVCGLIVTTMLAAAPEILDLPEDQPLLEAELTDNFVQQLRLILLGAAGWRPRPRTAAVKSLEVAD